MNVIVADALGEQGREPFGFFEFALMGLPLVLCTIVVSVVLGPWLLPRRGTGTQADLSGHTDTLIEQYRLQDGFYRLSVTQGSPVLGTAVGDVQVPAAVRLIGVQARGTEPVAQSHRIGIGDTIVVTGASAEIQALAREGRFDIAMTPLTAGTREELLSQDAGLAEVVVRPRSALIGAEVFPGIVRSGVAILGVLRGGVEVGAQQTRLKAGDALLLHGDWETVDALEHDKDVLVVDSPDLVRRQNTPLGPRAWRALAITAATVALLASGIVHPAIAALAGAVLLVLFRVVQPAQAYRAISWQTLLLLGGMIPLSVAITDSGLADAAADVVVEVIGGGPVLLLLVLFLLTAVLGQLISNTATVLIIVPIALAAAAETGVAPEPVLMLVATAGAASFLTPIATPANMIVMAPGGYRFGDYWKLGGVTMLVWLVVAMVLIPLLWPL